MSQKGEDNIRTINEINEVENIGNLSLMDENACTVARTRIRDGEPYSTVADDLETEISDVLFHVKGFCDCEVDVEPYEDDQPWRKKEIINHLYFDKEMYFKKMAELLGCHDETARNWVGKHNPEEDNVRHTSSRPVRNLQKLDVGIDEDIEDALARQEEENE